MNIDLNWALTLDRLQKLSDAASPGLWEIGGPWPSTSVIKCVDAGSMSHYDGPEPPTWEAVAILDNNREGEPVPQSVADAAFIVAARAAIPTLIREIRTLHKERDNLKETMGSWAVLVQNVYEISTRGVLLHGLVMYGNPGKNSKVTIGTQYSGMCVGIETDAKWAMAGLGDNVGVLLDSHLWFHNEGSKTAIESSKKLFSPGWAIIGTVLEEGEAV